MVKGSHAALKVAVQNMDNSEHYPTEKSLSSGKQNQFPLVFPSTNPCGICKMKQNKYLYFVKTVIYEMKFVL